VKHFAIRERTQDRKCKLAYLDDKPLQVERFFLKTAPSQERAPLDDPRWITIKIIG